MKNYQAALSMWIVIILLFGCGSGESPAPVGQRCYLNSADYLAHGREWTEMGKVTDAFYILNTDPDIEMYHTSTFDRQEVSGWLRDGYRVVIQYRIGQGMEHSAPIHDITECDGLDITMIYVAGDFNAQSEAGL